MKENDKNASRTESIKEKLPEREKLSALADLYKVFGDETRVRILYTLLSAELSDAELSVCELSAALGMTVSAVSHQLRILKQAKLVTACRDGKTVRYRLADSHVHSILAQGTEHISENDR